MTKVEKVIHVVLITICVVSIGIVVKKRLSNNRREIRHAVLEPSENGAVDLPPVDWSKGRMNVVLLLSDHCPFCQESITFYRRIGKQRADHKRIKLYVASQQPRATIDDYLGKNKLVTDGSLYVPHGFGGPVVSTPTLLLVNNRGVVVRKYVGVLDSSQEDDVLNLISY